MSMLELLYVEDPRRFSAVLYSAMTSKIYPLDFTRTADYFMKHFVIALEVTLGLCELHSETSGASMYFVALLHHCFRGCSLLRLSIE